MAKVVEFRYYVGLKEALFRNARLRGSWDAGGHYSDQWSEYPMQEVPGEDGCPSFVASVSFDDSQLGKKFRWGVVVDGPQGANIWGIATEIQSGESMERLREFTLTTASAVQSYYLTYARRLGARKLYQNGSSVPDLRFSVWAPNAQAVDVVFGDPASGYIDDAGNGKHPTFADLHLQRDSDGLWSGVVSPFSTYDGAPYMYRIKTAQGGTKYRTDIFSRAQIGRGDQQPGSGWDGKPASLDGTKSCSLVISLDHVDKEFSSPAGAAPERISTEEFWASEWTIGVEVPTRVEDLVIYELHVGSLGYGNPDPGTLADAIGLLDHLRDLGVNCVELLPLSEFSGKWGWGYGDSHHFVIESSAGGRDQYLHFVRECHRRGIAVIQDVCYNHYDNNAERAQWQYDSTAAEQNIYYWYEGKPSDYSFADGGYINNGSSGWAPRYWEEIVRQQFVSSAATFVDEFHIDGLRVDLTQALHRDNSLNANGWGTASANQFGAKLLREWSRTLRMIHPTVMLIAEDHSEWEKVTHSADAGGLGFSATWYAAFYHHLIGDSDMAGGKARLLKAAGTGGDEPLDLNQFAGALYASKYNKVVYHESHDEAGNAGGTARTMRVAVNNAPLFGATRSYAEARSRVVAGLSILSAGTPMFFMAEEVAAQKPYTVNDFRDHREDIQGERANDGAKMFSFYQAVLTLSRRRPAVRSQNIDIVHVNVEGRVIAFTRRSGSDELLVIASLRHAPYLDGYVVQTDPWRLPDGHWQEIFNSDSSAFGGNDIGNFGANVPVAAGRIELRLPANGFLVLHRN